MWQGHIGYGIPLSDSCVGRINKRNRSCCSSWVDQSELHCVHIRTVPDGIRSVLAQHKAFHRSIRIASSEHKVRDYRRLSDLCEHRRSIVRKDAGCPPTPDRLFKIRETGLGGRPLPETCGDRRRSPAHRFHHALIGLDGTAKTHIPDPSVLSHKLRNGNWATCFRNAPAVRKPRLVYLLPRHHVRGDYGFLQCEFATDTR